ncbi:MAG: glycosyltransferase family 39 protein [Thermoflexales bacterium]
MQHFPKNQLAWFVLLASSAAYLLLGLSNLALPGLYYDEAADAVPALELLQGLESSAIRSVTIFGRQWPIMMLHHIGPTTIYTSLVGLALFGPTVEALRATQLCVGLVGLALLWLLARDWFGHEVAALAAILCATAPVYVWWSRAGANWTVPLIPLSLGMWHALGRWWRAGSRAALALAAFLFGFGVTTKILFVWWLFPAFITALFGLGLRSVAQRLRCIGPVGALATFAAMLLGLSPLLAHNIYGLDTAKFLLSNLTKTTTYGHNNLDIINNLPRVWQEFLRAIGGDTLHFQAPAILPIGAVAFLLALAWLGASLKQHYGNSGYAARLLVLATPLAVLPLSTVSTSSIGATYVFVIMPFAWLAIALSAAELWQKATVRWAKFLIGLSFLVLVFGQVVGNVAIHRFFAVTGGRGLWSDAINPLAEVLRTRFSDRTVVAVDWGFRRNLEFLTANQIRPREVFDYSPRPSPAFDALSLALLREPENIYLFHAPHTTAFGGHWERFERAALKSHMQLVPLAVIRERDGITHTLIYEAQPAQRNFEPPNLASLRNARLASGVALLGGEVRYDATQREVAVMLYWQALTEPLPDDTVLLHIVNQATGEVVQAADTQPVYGAYPFPRWQRGEVVLDPHWVTLPEGLPPGTYQVRVGAYDPQTMQRRAIDDPRNDAGGDSLMLQTFELR